MASIHGSSYPRLADLPQGGERVLALEAADLIAPNGPIPLEGVAHRRFAELRPALLAELAPTVVVMPLFSAGQDALSMIEALEAAGFAGRILVIAPTLPRPRLVERELRAAGPGDRLTLMTPEPLGPPTS